ncbi:MAG: peptidoglycan DD-metalloendopeptidase family protein [Pseudomonadota bacterium]
MRAWLLAMIAALSSVLASGQEGTEEQTRQQLDALRAEISEISQDLKLSRQRRGGLQSELRESELQLAKLKKNLLTTDREIVRIQGELKGLASELAKLRTAATNQQEAVAKEVRSLWASGKSSEVRLLLSQDDPQDLARLLAYHRYILEARSQVLQDYATTTRQLQESETEQSRQQVELTTYLDRLTQQTQAIELANNTRREVILKIEQDLKTDEQVLAARQRDELELQNLLNEIVEAAAQLITQADVQSFEAAKGAMPWPVAGRLVHRFGNPRNQGKMRWQGVSLQAEAGSTVSAVHHGRVVFADWLRGSGLLLVLDHGEGFMSLYAHNDSLLREVGDWVEVGSAIATVGSSGGQDQASLYFEIRKDGEPTDPLAWVARDP